jgi:hypothetical protein
MTVLFQILRKTHNFYKYILRSLYPQVKLALVKQLQNMLHTENKEI